MKQSPERDLIASRHPDLLGLDPSEGLFRVGLVITQLQIDISALRKLEHSYRTKLRWERKGSSGLPTKENGDVDVEALTPKQFKALLEDMQRR